MDERAFTYGPDDIIHAVEICDVGINARGAEIRTKTHPHPSGNYHAAAVECLKDGVVAVSMRVVSMVVFPVRMPLFLCVLSMLVLGETVFDIPAILDVPVDTDDDKTARAAEMLSDVCSVVRCDGESHDCFPFRFSSSC